MAANSPPRLSRRRFLEMTILLAAGACRPADILHPTVYVPGSAASTPSPDTGPHVIPTLTPIPPAFRLAEAVPITPQRMLYRMSYRGTPENLGAAGWTLHIDGLVRQPLALTQADIRGLPAQQAMRTLQCISNPVGGGLIGNLVWDGTPLAPILKRAGILPEAAYVHFEAADGYTTSVRLAELLQPDVLLVYGANGEALESEHGYPLRILIPGLYGQKQPKWITRIHLASEDKLGYWENEARGWSNTAEILTSSAIREGLAGWAFAGRRAITAVEVQITRIEGRASRTLYDWFRVPLAVPPDPLAWTWWRLAWKPSAAGVYQVAVRATDESGYRQDRFPGGLFGEAFPDGTNAIHQETMSSRD